MAPLSLNAPLPSEPRLAQACRTLLEQPSLELGIDVGYIDLVIQIGSPRSIATNLTPRCGQSGSA